MGLLDAKGDPAFSKIGFELFLLFIIFADHSQTKFSYSMTDRKDWLSKIGKTIDAKDSDGFAGLMTENGVFRFGNAPEVTGRKAIADYVAAFFNMIGSSEHSVINSWEHNGNVIWEGQVKYTRLDGKQVTVNFCNIFYMKDELIDKYLIFIDNTPLFE